MPDPVEAFLAGYAPDVQEISRTLRAMVKSAMPQANEIVSTPIIEVELAPLAKRVSFLLNDCQATTVLVLRRPR